jgi:hypothetical protein
VHPLVYGDFGIPKTTGQGIPQETWQNWGAAGSKPTLSHEMSAFDPKTQSFGHSYRGYCWIAPTQPNICSQAMGLAHKVSPTQFGV